MMANEELELKVLVTREQFISIIKLYDDLKFIPQWNTYFESKQSDHYAFRIRTSQGRKLFTLKHKSDGKTMEYETEFTGQLEDNCDIMQTLASFNEFPPFKVIGELLTIRAMHVNELAELCFDINYYNGQVDYEIEYEVKSPHDHTKVFKDILSQAGIPFIENRLSKYKRCLKTIKR